MKSLSEPVEETEEFLKESEVCLKMFENWNEVEQVTFVENLLSRMCHYQHGQINTFLKPMLQRDFISALPGTTITKNFNYLMGKFSKWLYS